MFSNYKSSHVEPGKKFKNRISRTNMHTYCSFSYTYDTIRNTKPCVAAAFAIGISVG
jgi:hypothetical protein